MKILIYVIVFFLTTVINDILGSMVGWKLGKILLYFVALFISRWLCKKWYAYRFRKSTKFVFKASCVRCDGTTVDTKVVLSLDKAEAHRLILYGTKEHIYNSGFENCFELSSIYLKVYDIAVRQLTEQLIGLINSGFADLEEAKYKGWKIDDTYSCVVYFPENFKNYLVEEKTPESSVDESVQSNIEKCDEKFINHENNKIAETAKICFCRKCGTKLSDDSRFCKKCGTEIVKDV